LFDTKGSLPQFLLMTTIISGGLGFVLLSIADNVTQTSIESTGKTITFLTRILLLGTGILQLNSKNIGIRTEKDVTQKDGVILGFTQSLCCSPRLSRSGLTVSALILRKFTKVESLRLSFLMSLPIIFLGNIILNLDKIMTITLSNLIGVFTAFIVGLVSIKTLLFIAQKINFGILWWGLEC